MIPEREGDYSFVFKHPFTMILTGPTGAGKTQWVLKMLTYAQQMISPAPQRILYLYSQWQPLYDEMQKVVSGIEFVRHLPSDLDSDAFFDPRAPSLVFIDDLMSDATRSESVCNLFTRGSHHRNVSVVCLMQNLFYHGKESRTMSLNSHYLVLFKNPRDQQQISFLARQMYPGKPKLLLDKYVTHTKRPFGYLLVDLKPDTSETRRLLTKVFPDEKEESPLGELAWIPPIGNTGVCDPSIKQNCEGTKSCNATIKGSCEVSKTVIPKEEPGQATCSLNNMPFCEDCGIVFQTEYDKLRHVDRGCAEKEARNLKRKLERNESEAKRAKSDSSEEEDDNGDNERKVFLCLRKRAIENTSTIRDSKLADYANRGISKDDAEDKVTLKMLRENMAEFLDLYSHLLKNLIRLRSGPVHRQVVRDVDYFLGKGFQLTRAVVSAVKKNRYLLEGVLDEDFETDDDMDSQTDNNSETVLDEDSQTENKNSETYLF
ncbi:hypothetical protein BOW17_12325 [Solemya velum gill symbiont]|nr:hypothetical protein BOW17_12325 [Solemya velum gill symbiont]